MTKNLYVMVGLPGSGKSTYLQQFKKDCIIISRDSIRFSMLGDTYFDNEKLVFKEFVNQIQSAIDSNNYKSIYADATHISEKSRNKLLNKLNLKGVSIHIIFINTPIDVCIERNSHRVGIEKVPEDVVRDFQDRLELPTHNEKYKYKSILEVRSF